MERLGYVKKELYERAVWERDELKRRADELEAEVSKLRKEEKN